MPFEIVRNDITNMQVDAIVNAANPHPAVGSGVDSRIHKKAGESLLIARKQIGEIAYGNAEITSAYNLNAKYVIHAVSPVWFDGTKNEAELLESCYTKSLHLALEHKCESIAFPLLSTGNHGFPKNLALQIAIGAFSKFLMQHDMQIYLVVFDRNAVALSEKLFQSVKSYIDETYVQETELEEYSVKGTYVRDRKLTQHHLNRRIGAMEDVCDCSALPAPECLMSSKSAPRKLEDILGEVDETFSETLLRLIDQKGLTDSYVYKKANIDRKHFSKIRNNKDYKPKKETAIAFAIALELNLDETLDFIGRAGFTLTHSSKFDIIIEYFLMEENYDIFEINDVLFAFGQTTLAG